jgi:hypothetical protein
MVRTISEAIAQATGRWPSGRVNGMIATVVAVSKRGQHRGYAIRFRREGTPAEAANTREGEMAWTAVAVDEMAVAS